MKAVKNTPEKPTPRLMALVNSVGEVYLKGADGSVVLVTCEGLTTPRTLSLSKVMYHNPELTRVYEGESITITF